MSLIKIGSLDLTDIVSYEVTHKDITKEVKNSLGDTFIYVLGEKVTLKIGLGALDQSKMSALMTALGGITVIVEFVDTDGTTKTKTMKRPDRVAPIRSFLSNEAYWDESSITLTEL